MKSIKYGYFLGSCLWILFASIDIATASSLLEIKETFPRLELNNELLNPPESSPQVKIISSSYSNKPQGIGLTYELDPKKRYLVAITGQFYTIRPLLGIRISGTPDRIIPAPDGRIFLNIFNTQKVTLFLNIQPQIKYHLKSVQFLNCPQCIDQEELINLIRKNKPQLDNLLKRDTLLAAHSLLDWTANATPFALSPSFHDKTKNFNRMAAEEIYNLFRLNHAAVYCGGSSLFLNKIFALFGINSITVDFGDTSGFLTHTTVLVTKYFKNRWEYYIFDPTFNATFHNPETGHILTIQEILDLPPANIENKIKINQRLLHKREFLTLKKDAHLCPKIKKTKRDYLICSINNYTLQRYFDLNNTQFTKNGYSKNLSGFFQLFRNRIFTIGGFSKPNSKNALIKLFKDHKIPLGYAS